MKYLEDRILERGSFHGERNYTFLPGPRPARQPEPAPAEPAGPDAALLEALAALAGVPAPRDLHAAVALAWHADREHRLTLSRGRQRRRAPNKTSTYLKLSDEGILVAAACRIRLGMTWALLGRLLGTDPSTICVPGNAAIPILEKHGITAPPARPCITTPARLLAHAGTTGITITIPETGKHSRRERQETRHARS